MKKTAFFFTLIFLGLTTIPQAQAELAANLWFPSTWQENQEQAQAMADGLSRKSGLNIVARIAKDYPEILSAFGEKKPQFAYVGSMAVAVIQSRRLGQPLLQAYNGEQFYSCLFIYPQKESAAQIFADSPHAIAYTIGATSGETCAKAATSGEASLGVTDHQAAADAVVSSQAKGAFVKNHWWLKHKKLYPNLASMEIEGISDEKNPDNLLIASCCVAPEVKSLITGAAIQLPELFKASTLVPFDSENIQFTLKLMEKAGIDPVSYAWPE